MEAIIETMEELQIDVLVMPETNTPWNTQLKGEILSIGRKICRSFKCSGASSDNACVGKYQPGGVGLLARGNIVGRINKAEVDNSGLGRWDIEYAKKQTQELRWHTANR
eukprot:9867508-Ditylum_brightwellii.AAC.1